jgi:hypothetical protein
VQLLLLNRQLKKIKKMKQTIMYTTLPNGRININGKNYLRLSLHFSIRLTHGSDTTMDSFPDILQWAQKIKDIKNFKIQWNNSDAENAPADTEVIEPRLWEALVHPGIKVSGFVIEDNTKAKIHAYPIKELNETILNVYREFGISSPVNLINPRDFLQKGKSYEGRPVFCRPADYHHHETGGGPKDVKAENKRSNKKSQP